MYGGIFDSIENILQNFGINADTTAATATAFASPTAANIQKVKDAFAFAGTSAPPELLNYLYARQAQSYADNPFFSAASLSTWLPIGIGIVAIILISKKRRARG